MNLRVSDLPVQWRAPAALALFAAGILAAGWGAMLVVQVLARAEAREVIAADRETFKRAALEAARAGAREAVVEAVTPVLLELRGHDAWDHESQRQNERRLEVLERKQP
jgi:hypothetical protein